MVARVPEPDARRERERVLVRKALSTVTAIGLDFDNTIADEEHWISARWRRVLGGRALAAPDIDVVAEMARIRVRSPSDKRHLDDLLAEIGAPAALKDELLQAFLTATVEESVLPGAVALVHWAKERGLRVGILTNGKRASHESRIATVGLSTLVDAVVYGDDGRKPDAERFRSLMRVLRVDRPDQFLYIGDSLAEDVVGACAVGAYACWLHGSHEITEPEAATLPRAAFGVHSFEELRALLTAAHD